MKCIDCKKDAVLLTDTFNMQLALCENCTIKRMDKKGKIYLDDISDRFCRKAKIKSLNCWVRMNLMEYLAIAVSILGLIVLVGVIIKSIML